MRTFSFGGGVQSMAVMVLQAQGQLQYDHFLFANVGDDSENPNTLTYMAEYAKPYAKEFNISLIELERKWVRGERAGKTETLYGRLTREGSRSIGLPVRMNTGAPGRRACTADFKIAVIAKWLRQHGATKANPATTGLGISRDEFHRARTDSGIAYQLLEYPLIELNLSRHDCMKIIQSAGLPVPPKSSCYFCPFHSPVEWQRLKREEPELFAKSVELELIINDRRAMLGKDNVWFHRALQPLDQAVSDQMSMFDKSGDIDMCESGYCMT